MISNVSELYTCIVYMTAVMLLADQIQGVVLDLDTPPLMGIILPDTCCGQI